MAIRSALYIDFDNFFGGLIRADPEAALAVVERPSTWINRLTRQHDDGEGRRWLVLRCYMNPSGWVPDPRNPGERLYFSAFRSSFTQAGVEVVDCPSLTRAQKNGADIRIVVDVLSAMRATTRYDEFVIASADADFTPLLQAVRADDRRTTMIATQSAVVAYEALADRLLDDQDILELASLATWDDDELGDITTAGAEAVEAVAVSTSAPALGSAEGTALYFQSFADEVRARYDAAEAALNLATLATDVLAALGPDASSRRWFGHSGFAAAIRAIDLPEARLSSHHLWDATRHEEPPRLNGRDRSNIPGPILQYSQVTNLPLIESEKWPVVYEALAAYAALNTFNLADSTRWSRDWAASNGVTIGRTVFLYVVRACRAVDVPLNRDPAPSAELIARALYDNTMQISKMTGFAPSEAEADEIAQWLHTPDSRAAGEDT